MDYFSQKNIFKFLALGFLVFLGLIFFGDYRKISESVSLLSVQTILLLFLLTLLNDIFRFFKWEYFLRTVGIKIKKRLSLAIFFSGLAMAITPGKVGEVLKSQMLKEKAGVPRRNSIMVVFSERLTDVIGLSLLSLFGLSAFFLNLWALIFIFALLAFILFILSNENIFFKITSIAGGLPVVGKYAGYFRESYSNSKILFTPVVLIVSTGISIVSWFFECLALFVLLQAVGVNISMASAIFIFSFSTIFGSLLVLPGGIGAAEGSFVALLLFAGATSAVASLATIVIRITTLWFGVSVGMISFLFLKRFHDAGSAGETDLKAKP